MAFMNFLSLVFFRCSRYFSHTSALSSAPSQSSSPPQQWPKSLSAQNKVTFTGKVSLHRHNDTDHLRFMKQFCLVIKDLCKNPRNYIALSNLDSLLKETHFLDSATSVFVVEGLSRIKKLQRAKNVLWNLKNNGYVSDYFLYSLVIDCLVKDGLGDVEIFWGEICGSELQRIGVSDYIIYLCKSGDLDEIKRVCERVLMGEWVLREYSYMALIGALCRGNEGLLAKEVLLKMNNNGFMGDDVTYVVIFQCLCRIRDLDGADLILRELVRRKYKLDICIYGSFIYGLCKSGKFREAAKLFHKLTKKNHFMGSPVEPLKQGRRAIFQLDSEGVVPEVMAYETYFRSLCSVGRLNEAQMLLKKMMKKRTVPEICVYGSFIKALFLAGREEDAIKFFCVERKKGLVCVDEIARYIIVGLCENDKVDDALSMFDDIVMRGGHVYVVGVCNVILGSLWKEGRVAEAESLFEMINFGSFGPPDELSYTTMVNGYCAQGDVSKALYVFGQMLSNNILVHGRLYEMIIEGLCDRGRLKEAHKYLNDMIENGHLVPYNRLKGLLVSIFVDDKHGISLDFEV